MEEDVSVDALLFLTAIIENEGGTYTLPVSTLQDLALVGEDRLLVIDPSLDQTNFTLKIVSRKELDI